MMKNDDWANTLKKLGKDAKNQQKLVKEAKQQEKKQKALAVDFSKEMKDVKPIKSSNKYIVAAEKTPIKVRAQTTELDENKFTFVGTDYLDDEPPRQYSAGGQGKNDIRKLLSGQVRIVSTLDLHNYNLEEAQIVLNEFIDHVRNRGVAGEIIHGSGLNSKGFASEMKKMVRKWLIAQPEVVAYTEPHQNNDGSVLILLKRKKRDFEDMH